MTGAAARAIDTALDRIARHDAALHAFVTVSPAHAREQARHEDAMAALGKPAGPLYGMAVGIKDIIDVAGLPTGGGSFTRDGAASAAEDAPVVQRLRAAGAVVAGKTHTVEYAFGGWGTNVSLGAPRNPWDMTTHRITGGSSNGTGAAVAAGLVPAGLGSDTGGSIRVPASFCGLVGLNTTAGLLPITGVLPLSSRFDTIGPMARSVAACARLFAAMLAEDAPHIASGAAFAADPLTPLARGIEGLRIGVLQAPEVALHADTARVFAETQATLAKLGAVLTPVRMPRAMPDYLSALGGLIALDAFQNYQALALAEPCRIGAPVAGRIRAARDIPATWLVAELARQRAEIAATAEIFTGIDALLTPATPFPAIPLADVDEATSPATFTRFVNYLDLAGIVLPMGLSAERLPVGMQIVVPGLQEVRALRIAAALEAARGVEIAVELT